jgi:hypothetical protein
MTEIAPHIFDADGAGMETHIDCVDPGPLITRIRELGDEVGDESGGDRRAVVLVEPRKHRHPKIMRRLVAAGAVDELRRLMDGGAG